MGRSGKVLFPSLVDSREAGDEEEARVGGLEEKGNESMGQNVSASDIDVVGLGEAGAERDIASEVLNVKGGT